MTPQLFSCIILQPKMQESSTNLQCKLVSRLDYMNSWLGYAQAGLVSLDAENERNWEKVKSSKKTSNIIDQNLQKFLTTRIIIKSENELSLSPPLSNHNHLPRTEAESTNTSKISRENCNYIEIMGYKIENKNREDP